MGIPPQIRAIIAVLTGIIIGFAAMMAVQAFSPFQPPVGVSIDTGAAYNRWVSSLPVEGYAWFLFSYLISGLTGGAVAGFIARHTRYRIAPLVSGFVLLVLAIGNFLAFNHPEWVTYTACIGFMIAAWAGGWLGRRVK